MALTASTQSALPLTWDETIVPALRKRLESESRILAKRMSTASMPEHEDIYSSDPTSRERNASPTFSGGYSRPNSMTANGTSQPLTNGLNGVKTHHRTDTTDSTSSRTQPVRRTRTYSQPYAVNAAVRSASANGHVNGLPTPDSSRSTSPQYSLGRNSDAKPTRIPVVTAARGRSASSSHSHAGRSIDTTRNGAYPFHTPPTSSPPELWAVEEVEPSNNSHSTISVPSRQRSGKLDENPLFEASRTSPIQPKLELPSRGALRPSMDSSEERPFEHWYRGDVHRNGGVGELRVGAKQEMLDIANYGHRYGGRPNPSTRAPSTSRGMAVTTDDFPVPRKRADSMAGNGARESFHMDEERARQLSNVLHEDPPTDIEDVDHDMSNSFSEFDTRVPHHRPATPPSMPTEDPTTPTNHNRSIDRERNAPQTRIPGPAVRQNSAPPSPQPAFQTTKRAGSEPPTFPSPASSSTVTAPVRFEPTPLETETQKRRAKSPPATTPSVSKKPKNKPSKSPSRLKIEEDKRRSVAYYPTPTGDNLMDSIPSWTQPPADGNWDEVVLPVVARKRGLDGQYENANGNGNGNGHPKKPEEVRVEPAPGTFGFDHSKYRPPRESEDIPMNEFGQIPQDVAIPEEPEEDHGRTDTTKNDDTRSAYIRPPRSPAPFAHYASKGKNEAPQIRIQPPTFDMEQMAKEEEHDAGCCKCVIM